MIKKVILAACENLLYSGDSTWVKQKTGTHDVTMGSYSGAELCELVGLFVLHQLREVNILPVLYRDDGLLMSRKPPRANKKNCRANKQYIQEK